MKILYAAIIGIIIGLASESLVGALVTSAVSFLAMWALHEYWNGLADSSVVLDVEDDHMRTETQGKNTLRVINTDDATEDAGGSFFHDLRDTLLNIKQFGAYGFLQKTYAVMLILCIVAVLPMPYEFYVSLRMLICIGLFIFLYALNKSTLEGMTHYKYILLGLVVLYNPLFVIHLGSKVIWAVVNTGTLYLLFTLRKRIGP